MRFSWSVLRYKLQAAAASFLVFLLFAACLTLLARHFWYPDYLFWLDGGFQGLRLVYSVDFVLGPLLVMVFFHPEKSRRKLLFDIILVACIQISAMAWGTYQVYKERPIAVVYGSDRFISVATGIMALQQKSAADLQVYSSSRPPYIYRRETQTEAERLRKQAMLIQYGFHFESQAWLFQPFAENLDHVFVDQDAIRDFIASTPRLKTEWDAWLAASGQPAAFWRLAFYEGRYANALLIFSDKGEYASYLRMDEPLPDVKHPVF